LMRQVVIAGPERRRRWSDEERLSILAEAFAPGACVADVARRRDVSTSLIYTWRRRFLEENGEPSADETEPGFAEAVTIEDGAAASSSAVPAVVVDLARGQRVSIFASASSGQVTAVLKALR